MFEIPIKEGMARVQISKYVSPQWAPAPFENEQHFGHAAHRGGKLCAEWAMCKGLPGTFVVDDT